MISVVLFIIIAIVVGFVTNGLKIKFDRFFTIILIVSLLHLSASAAINIFLWIIFLSATFVIWSNKKQIEVMFRSHKKRFLILVPSLAFVGTLAGSVLFFGATERILLVSIGVVALLYGLRLVFVHFRPHELAYSDGKVMYQKVCRIAGPIASGISVGFVGTSLKPLKIPFAVKIGKLNLNQVYLGNTLTAFYASLFAIILHSVVPQNHMMTYRDVLLGIGLWVAISLVDRITHSFFRDTWRRPFQVAIGIILILVSLRFI
jgi:uncharacterized membrane protein YfcA